MYANTLSELTRICFELPHAIDKEKESTILFTNFPNGCRRDSAIILGLYSIKIGYQDVNYCRRPYDDDFKSHGWIEVENLIIDLTADQFGLGFLPITIISNTTTRTIYQSKVCEPCSVHIASTDIRKLIQDYNLIIANLKI